MLTKDKSRRFDERVPSTLRVKVSCCETVDDEWEEVTQLINISRLGVRFTLSRRVESGQLLYLSLAMPAYLRAFDRTAPLYNVWSVVRTVKEVENLNGVRFEVGVALIGQHAPDGSSDPTKRYNLKPAPGRNGLWQARERGRNES